MTTKEEERTVSTEALAPHSYAATFAHLRSGSAAVKRLLVDADRSDPNYYVLLMVGQSIHSAEETLMDCLHGSC